MDMNTEILSDDRIKEIQKEEGDKLQGVYETTIAGILANEVTLLRDILREHNIRFECGDGCGRSSWHPECLFCAIPEEVAWALGEPNPQLDAEVE